MLGDLNCIAVKQRFPQISRVDSMKSSTSVSIAGHGIAAGAAGGIAEIIWILVFALATGTDAATLARGVTTAVGANLLFSGNSVASGVAIHMILAVTLGTALAFAWSSVSQRWPTSPYAVGLVALAVVWTINFLIILPLLSPDFVQIVPYPVSMTSKLLFGLTAAAVLSHQALIPPTLLARADEVIE
jgi:hypothetical protein